MIIQPYIENCIKHAFGEATVIEGMIQLHLFWKDEKLLCRIEDNGIGREKAATKKSEQKHKSAALSITAQRLQLTSSSLNQKFYFEIIDKKDSNEVPTGTIVIFALPYKNSLDDKSNNS